MESPWWGRGVRGYSHPCTSTVACLKKKLGFHPSAAMICSSLFIQARQFLFQARGFLRIPQDPAPVSFIQARKAQIPVFISDTLL